MPSLPAHYHVGIVVADLADARVRFAELLGVRWGPVMRLERSAYRDAQGRDVELPTAMCYSVGEPCIELIEEVSGTVWVRNPHSNLHHLGYWSDDLPADSRALTTAGCPLQLCGRDGPRAPAQFAYHRDDALGVRIEIVDAAIREAMSFLFEPPTPATTDCAD